MSFRDENGKHRVPKEIDPRSVTDPKMRGDNWKNRILKKYGEKIYFDQDIRTGECYFCKRMGDAQKSRVTYLHHVRYYSDEPLRWTIEVCHSCHIKIDERLQEKIDVSGYKERRQREEYERRTKEPDYYTRFCMNIDGKFLPVREWCPNQEIYDKLMEAYKKRKNGFQKRYYVRCST